MEILADRDIIAIAEACAGFGSLRLYDGRKLCAAELGAAEVLLVRSVTKVDGSLLAGSRVRFVGTATAGIDHVDTAWLERAGIALSAAAGCNAHAVAEHVVTCLYQHALAGGRDPRALVVGVVGWGNAGRALTALLDRLGIAWLASDPPLAHQGMMAAPASLAEVLAADVVSLHVPLTSEGQDATAGLIDAQALAALKPGALLINAARGGVVDEHALCARLRDGPPLAAAIDCWSGEPALDTATVALATWATPHIAGHTLEARLNATAMVHAAVAAYLGRAPHWTPPAPPAAGTQPFTSLPALLDEVHPLGRHTARLHLLSTLPRAERGAEFDRVRAQHGLRREFAAYTVARAGLAPDTCADLCALGFRLEGHAGEARARRQRSGTLDPALLQPWPRGVVQTTRPDPNGMTQADDLVIGTPLAANARRLLLLGAGELGKEVAIEAMRLGLEVIAVDRYAGAPAMQVAHRAHVIDMLDGAALAAVIEREQPHYIVPEVEAIATERLVELEQAGFNVVPTANATCLTMDREGIRRLAAETLGLPTSPYRFAGSAEECAAAITAIGLPCVVKPVMSSSGKGQLTVRTAADAARAWDVAVRGGRAARARVIVEGFIDFAYEITLLTLRHAGGTTFCAPIGHLQIDGDYRESWQPQPMSRAAHARACEMAQGVTAALGGYGIFGVEFFIKGDQVWFSEVSPRPHDTGMVTMISQAQSQFALHVRAILGVALPAVEQHGPAASCAVLASGQGRTIAYHGLRAALAAPDTDVRLFGKPEVAGKRRLAVTLARGRTIEQARERARAAAACLTIDVSP